MPNSSYDPSSLYPTPCPFCAIASSNPSSSPAVLEPSSDSPLAHLILSTPCLIAFLDHAPIARGHVLVATRQHRVKLSDVTVQEGRELGAWLGIVSRAVVRVADPVGNAGEGNREEEMGDWNVVQNNGAHGTCTLLTYTDVVEPSGIRAAQVVPHVHFHIIPRSGKVPELKARSWTVFGRGQREELDEEDAVVLSRQLRESLSVELERVREKEGDAAVRLLLEGTNDKPRL